MRAVDDRHKHFAGAIQFECLIDQLPFGAAIARKNGLPLLNCFASIEHVKARIYLDVCCLNRPFDNTLQDRVRLEAEAVKAILRRIECGQWEGVKSPAVKFEISRIPDMDRLIEVGLIADRMQVPVSLTMNVRKRALKLESLGFGGLDALHLAFAEEASATILLTTDDALLKRAKRYQDEIRLEVDNPLRWFERVVRK